MEITETELKETFELFEDDDGSIDSSELEMVLRALGIETTEQEMADIHAKQTGAMQFQEFADLVSTQFAPGCREEAPREPEPLAIEVVTPKQEQQELRLGKFAIPKDAAEAEV